MEPVTRRSFLRTSSAGAVGVASAAALGPMLAPGGQADWPDYDDDDRRDLDDAVVSVLDARRGKVELLVGNQSIVFKDRDLVRRLARAGR
jgi:hypothetical protein